MTSNADINSINENENFGNKLVLVLFIGFIVLAGVFGYAMRSPIPIEDPQRDANINSYSCDQLWNMSIQISNQGFTSDNSTHNINYLYSHSLEVIDNELKLKCH